VVIQTQIGRLERLSKKILRLSGCRIAIGKHLLKDVSYEVMGNIRSRREWHFRWTSSEDWRPYKHHQDCPSNHRRMNEVLEMAIARLAEKVDAEVKVETCAQREAFLITVTTKMPVKKLLSLLVVEIELAVKWHIEFMREACPPGVAKILQQCQEGHHES
jgi:hypothetical protein